MSKVGTWAFGPAKDLTVQAGKGFGKAATYGAIAVAGAAVVEPSVTASTAKPVNKTTPGSNPSPSKVSVIFFRLPP